MKTKQKILEGLKSLDGYNKTEQVNGMINKAANKLYDSYRLLEMAVSHCNDPNLRKDLERIKNKIGRDKEIAGFIDNEDETIISELQDLMGEIKVG
jgi:hypothetical protein